LSANAQIVKQGNGYLYRMKHAVGKTLKYGVISTLSSNEAGGSSMKLNLPMVWKTVAVKNGVATIDTSVGPIASGGSNLGGQPVRNRIQIDTRGRLIGKAGSGQQLMPALPDKAIRIGQSWSASAPIELPMQGDKKITATYVFKGIKTVGGKSVAELAVKTTGQASGSGTMLLLTSDGTLFKSQLNISLTMTGPTGVHTKYHVTGDISRK
jgi:hypothetical protein